MLAASCTTPPPEQEGRAAPLPGPTANATGGEAVTLRLSTLEPDSLDPLQIDAPHELLLASQVFDGLVAYDPQTLKAVPAVARSWRVEEGGRTLVFKLRRGVRYQDGTSLTASDFVFAWSRLADPLASAPFSFLLEKVAGYRDYQRRPVSQLDGLSAPDDRTFEVHLSTPWPDFVSVLGHPALSPVPSAAAQSSFGTQPVGNGPYRLVSPVGASGPMIMERFDDYYGRPPDVARLEFEVVEEAEDAWPDFLAGDLDEASIPASALSDAESRYGPAGIVPLARLLYCGFNQQDERFQSRDLRVAVSLAVDRQAVAARVYGGLALPATGLVPPRVPGSQADACGAACRRDPEEAARMIEKLPRRSRTFSLDYTRSEVGDALAGTLATQLEQTGFHVKPRAHPETEYAALLRTDREEFFCLVWTADYPRQQAILEPLLKAGSADNLAGIDDRELNEVLAKARAERSPSRRSGLYRRAEDLALESMRLIPLVWFRSHLAVQPYVEGFSVDALGLFDASTLRVLP